MTTEDRSTRIRRWIDELDRFRVALHPIDREHFARTLDDMREAWRDELAIDVRRDTDRSFELCKHDKLARRCDDCKREERT